MALQNHTRWWGAGGAGVAGAGGAGGAVGAGVDGDGGNGWEVPGGSGGQNDDFRPLTYTLGGRGMGCIDKYVTSWDPI